jgi:hypothetical protein
MGLTERVREFAQKARQRALEEEMRSAREHKLKAEKRFRPTDEARQEAGGAPKTKRRKPVSMALAGAPVVPEAADHG